MELEFKSSIMKLEKNNITQILDYLNEIEVITLKNLNSFTNLF
jgi:hypothetical protein